MLACLRGHLANDKAKLRQLLKVGGTAVDSFLNGADANIQKKIALRLDNLRKKLSTKLNSTMNLMSKSQALGKQDKKDSSSSTAAAASSSANTNQTALMGKSSRNPGFLNFATTQKLEEIEKEINAKAQQLMQDRIIKLKRLQTEILQYNRMIEKDLLFRKEERRKDKERQAKLGIPVPNPIHSLNAKLCDMSPQRVRLNWVEAKDTVTSHYLLKLQSSVSEDVVITPLTERQLHGHNRCAELDGLNNLTTYFLSICPCNTTGRGIWSDPVTISTGLGNCEIFIGNTAFTTDNREFTWQFYLRADKTILERIQFVQLNYHPGVRVNAVRIEHPFLHSGSSWTSFPMQVEVHWKDDKRKPFVCTHEIQCEQDTKQYSVAVPYEYKYADVDNDNGANLA
jgi:hypothetical protein